MASEAEQVKTIKTYLREFTHTTILFILPSHPVTASDDRTNKLTMLVQHFK